MKKFIEMLLGTVVLLFVVWSLVAGKITGGQFIGVTIGAIVIAGVVEEISSTRKERRAVDGKETDAGAES